MKRTLAPLLALALGCGSAELDAGYAYGETHDLASCRTESLRRLEACESLSCQMRAPGFARGCARTSEFSKAACIDVPGSTLAASSWIKEKCTHSVNPKACYKVLQQPIARCLGSS